MGLIILCAVLGALAGWNVLDAVQTRRTLTALRRNCFVTNERGHRVRYVNASDECRARAETTKET